MSITEANLEKTSENPISESRRSRRKLIIGTIGTLLSLLVVYFGASAYFVNHFYFGSSINGVNISLKNVEKVNEMMADKLKSYSLTLKERGSKSETIKSDEIGMEYISGGDFQSFKNEQNPYKWILAWFNTDTYKMTEDIKYDEKLLNNVIDKLSCFDSSNITEPKNASFKNTGSGFVAVPEVMGNKVDKDVLIKKVSEAVLKQETSLDLEEADCYINPQYTLKSAKVVETKNLLDKYTSSKIVYTFQNNKETVDGSMIAKWITVDDEYNIILDNGKIKDYINNLSYKYNTVGKKRSFTTSSGNTISIGGGDYGWKIDKTKEIEALTAAIKEGQTVEKEPIYSQTALAYGNNDIGNTYVEIDLTKQHMWFYKNGKLVTDGDVVTGNVSKGNSTPAGVYKLKYKDKDAVLKGEDYATPVTYWMPFNGNIGIHDATWRNKFGGDIYMTKGSHGCVNAPYNLAKTIFENIKAGTPVICYKS